MSVISCYGYNERSLTAEIGVEGSMREMLNWMRQRNMRNQLIPISPNYARSIARWLEAGLRGEGGLADTTEG